VAVLKGDEVKIVDEQSINLPDALHAYFAAWL